MVEDGARPTGRGVAGGAIGGESGRDVIGVGGPLVILGVATVAIGGSACEFAVDVALRANDAYVRAGEWKRRFRMIEIGSGPTGGVVAGGAIGWKSGRDVIRIRGSLKILGVATIAIGRSAGEFVVDVAERAGHAHVRAGQWKWRLGMIEYCACPTGGVVAGGAVGREPSLNVIGIGCPLVILGVAGVAIGGGAREFVIDVAERASHADVRAGQGERSLGVIKNRSRPTRRVVAERAIR